MPVRNLTGAYDFLELRMAKIRRGKSVKRCTTFSQSFGGAVAVKRYRAIAPHRCRGFNRKLVDICFIGMKTIRN